MAGSFMHTLCLTDIASGWTECVALLVRDSSLVADALQSLKNAMPFPMREIDSDNGSEFMNEIVIAFCEKSQVEFTRSRLPRFSSKASRCSSASMLAGALETLEIMGSQGDTSGAGSPVAKVCYRLRMLRHYHLELEQEDDGRWIAEVMELPGVMAYGATQDAAVKAVTAIALRTLADQVEKEDTAPTSLVFERSA
jgi:predicted RNase H-like HicB family nuclease